MTPAQASMATLLASLLLLSFGVTADSVFMPSPTKYRIALVPKRITSPFFEVSHNGCLDAAQRLGVECLYVGPEVLDAEEQAHIISELVENRQIDGLAISVIDIPTITPVIENAVASGIPVVTFDSDAPGSMRAAYIGTNNTFFGQSMAKVLKQLIPEPNGGTYAVVSDEAPNIREREAGFKAALKASEWTEIDTSPSLMKELEWLAMEQIEEFGTFYPTAIVPLMGAPMRADGWKKFVNNHPNITIVVADGMPNQLELLAENYASGLVGQKPYEMGYRAVETLYDLIQGKTLTQDFIGTNLLEHTNIPLVLPELVVDQNHIGDLRYVGFILFGLILAVDIAFAGWMWRHRNVRVVKVAQPQFLIIIAVGVVVMASAMIPLGFDDSTGDYNGSAVCMSTPWLGTLGAVLTFSGLFAKTARVKKIFQAEESGAKPTEVQVLRPFMLLLTANVVVLTLWTVLDPLTYIRIDHTGTDGWNRIVSTYGSCQSENPIPFVVPLAVMNIGVLAFGNWQAYETRMIRSQFSESKYIALSMAAILQALLTGIPLLFIVRDSPKAYYLILVFMTFVISMVILVLMFLPKIVYAMGTKDMNISEQDQLIQRQIHHSIEAVQLKSSVRSSRNVSSMTWNLSCDQDAVLYEQEENQDSFSASASEEPVLHADCSFPQAEKESEQNSQIIDNVNSSPSKVISPQGGSLSRPIMLTETQLPDIEACEAAMSEGQRNTAGAATVAGAVAMGPPGQTHTTILPSRSILKDKNAAVASPVDSSSPGTFTMQPSIRDGEQPSLDKAVLDQKYSATTVARDEELKLRYRAAMLAAVPDEAPSDTKSSPSSCFNQQPVISPADVAAGPACDESTQGEGPEENVPSEL